MSLLKVLIATRPFVRPSRTMTEIPYYLGRLHMSLRWSDEKVTREIERIEKERRFSDKKDKERIAAVKRDGIFAKPAPIATGNPMEFRSAQEDGYAKEEVFADLQKEVEMFGKTEGLLRFVRTRTAR